MSKAVDRIVKVLLMRITDGFSVGDCRLVVLLFVLFLGFGVTKAQVRISDADVSLVEINEKEGFQPDGLIVRSNEVGTRRVLSVLIRTQDQMLLEQAIYKESAKHKIDPNLVFAIVWQESGFKLGAVSSKNARGPLQLMPKTAARFGVRNPHDPEEAASGGVAYLVWLLDRFGGNVSLALAGFNAGEGAVEAYLYGKTVILSDGKVINRRGIRTDGIPPYPETVNYVRKVAERYRLLRMAREVR